MASNISRRNFLAASATAAAVAAGLAGCSGRNAASSSGESDEKEQSIDIEATLEADIVVVGIGAAGMMAAIGAADAGARVIAIDAAPGFASTTNCSTTGSFFVEGSRELAHTWYVSKQEAYDFIMEGTHYSENPALVRNMIEVSGRAADILESCEMPLIYMFEQYDEEQAKQVDYMNRGGYCFVVSGEERASFFKELMTSRANVDCRWGCKGLELVVSDDGAVTGIICDDNGVGTKIDCRAVISCGGGFIANDEMKRQYYGGTSFVCQGFPTVDGSAMKMCQAAGAQMGKNFSVSVNEMGGCNYNASPSYSWMPGTGTNQCLYLMLLGGLLTDRTGKRFIRESRLVTSMMFTGEPLVRENTYYMIFDDAMLERVRTTPLLDLFPDEAKSKLAPILQMGFDGFTCDQLDDDYERAAQEGWAFKADSIAELAEQFGLDHLEETVARYNAIPEQGDDEFWLDAAYVNPVEQGPFYVFQYNPGSWCTLGGLRTDGYCRALNQDGNTIEGLYVAGLDADLFSVPYYSGGTAQGFSYASGLLAGETAASDIAS